MNVTGPIPIPPVRPDDPSVALRQNQRFSAEVLQVAGDRVVLSVEGVRFVARLMASDQAAELTERRTAQFVVRDANASTIVLQLAHTDAPPTQTGGLSVQALIPNLLQHAGLPVDEANTHIARALLNHGFPVTPQTIEELQHVLKQVGAWNANDAQAAAALKALGLPLTPQTLALVLGNLPPLETLVGNLRKQLQSLLRSPPSPHTAGLAAQALSLLDELVIAWGPSGAGLAEKLRQAVALGGASLEGALARLSGRQAAAEHSLLTLALLRRELASGGSHGALESLDQFLDGMRLMQFLNSPPEEIPQRGQWLRLDLPLARPDSPPGEAQRAQLRVAYRSEGETPQIDPENTRFILRIPLESGPWAGEVIQVDLAVVNRRVGAVITATKEGLHHAAEVELPGLRLALEALGYSLHTTRCELGGLSPATSADASAMWSSFNEVSVEA
jgi:hypothetical protein